MPVSANKRLTAVLLLLAAVTPAVADVLSELPVALQDKLLPVEEIALDDLDKDSRQQIDSVRKRVAAAIDSGLPDAELADAYGELGALYHVQFVYRPAKICYRNARRLAPDNFRWAYYAAYLAINSGELDKAVTLLEKARQMRPGYLAVTLRLADILLELNRLDSAKAAYRQVADAQGLEASAHYGLGQIALLRREYTAAIEHLERALVLQPDANRIHYSLARALRAAGQGDDARRHMAAMGEQPPSFRDPQIESLQALKQGSRIHFVNGMKAYRQLDFVAAQQAFARGLEREPDNTSARISYARALYLANEKGRSRKELETVLEEQPSNALAGYLLGVLVEEQGDREAATELYQRTIRHEPDHPGTHLQLANLLYQQGLAEQAVEHYAISMRGAPENPAVYQPYIGALLRLDKDGDTVMAVIDTALQRFPENPIPGFLHIQLLACTGTRPPCNAQSALASANRLAEQQWIPPHRELQALALAATGEFEEAISIQQALVSEAIWAMPVEAERLTNNLKTYQAGKLPAHDELFTWSLLQPPPIQGTSAFRDYPAARPY
jgi:tetratricopeptide (TPR) repeat protein